MALSNGNSLSSRIRLLGVSLGPELLSNGEFTTDTVWIKGLGWSISTGIAIAMTPGANSRLSQAIPLTPGVSYFVGYTVTAYMAGLLSVRLTNAGGTVSSFTGAAAVGTYASSVVLAGAADEISFVCNSIGSFSIDSVSLKRVL